MQTTIKTFSGKAQVAANLPRLPIGKVELKIGDGPGAVSLWLDPHEAATLAGEVERGAWAAMRQMQDVTAQNVARCLEVVGG